MCDTQSDLDIEFSKYVEMLHPYLLSINEKDVVECCTHWIERLSRCTSREKILRNKYIFLLCYQVSRGILEDPFTKKPPERELEMFSVSADTEGSIVSTRISTPSDTHCDNRTNVWLNPTMISHSVSDNFGSEDPTSKFDAVTDCKCENEMPKDCGDCECCEVKKRQRVNRNLESNVLCTIMSEESNKPHYRKRMQRPRTIVKTPKPQYNGSDYDTSCGQRAQNLIKKLREIKQQNVMFSTQMASLKKATGFRDEMKLPNGDMFGCRNEMTNQEFELIKRKFHELTNERNHLAHTVERLQSQLQELELCKEQELTDLRLKHELALTQEKTKAQDEVIEVKRELSDKLKDLKDTYEKTIKDKDEVMTNELANLKDKHERQIEEKNETIGKQTVEISRLESENKALYDKIHSAVTRYLDKCTDSSDMDTMSVKGSMARLQRKAAKLQRTKKKYDKSYQAKLNALEKEKQLMHCTMQLYMLKQKSQLADDNCVSLEDATKAINLLETKYRGIIASIQAAAIKRRIQDQHSLDMILQAAYGVTSDQSTTNINTEQQGSFSHSDKNKEYNLDEFLRANGFSFNSEEYSSDRQCRLSRFKDTADVYAAGVNGYGDAQQTPPGGRMCVKDSELFDALTYERYDVPQKEFCEPLYKF